MLQYRPFNSARLGRPCTNSHGGDDRDTSDCATGDFSCTGSMRKLSPCFIRLLRMLRHIERHKLLNRDAQVDLAREAAHLSHFIYNFRRWKDVSSPKPLYPLVHPSVLVETYEQGESVLDELEGHERVKSALAHIGTHALLKMLLVVKKKDHCEPSRMEMLN